MKRRYFAVYYDLRYGTDPLTLGVEADSEDEARDLLWELDPDADTLDLFLARDADEALREHAELQWHYANP